MDMYTRNTSAVRDRNWVMYGNEGALDSMPKHMDIQHFLRKAARRMRRQISSHQQVYSEY
jgi:hypothetical protein